MMTALARLRGDRVDHRPTFVTGLGLLVMVVDAAGGMSLYLDLRAEFDDLSCRHAKKGG